MEFLKFAFLYCKLKIFNFFQFVFQFPCSGRQIVRLVESHHAKTTIKNIKQKDLQLYLASNQFHSVYFYFGEYHRVLKNCAIQACIAFNLHITIEISKVKCHILSLGNKSFTKLKKLKQVYSTKFIQICYTQ